MSNPALLRVLRSGALTDSHIGSAARREQPHGLFGGERYVATFSSMPASHKNMSPTEHAKAMEKMKSIKKKSRKEKKGGDSDSSDSDSNSDSDDGDMKSKKYNNCEGSEKYNNSEKKKKKKKSNSWSY